MRNVSLTENKVQKTIRVKMTSPFSKTFKEFSLISDKQFEGLRKLDKNFKISLDILADYGWYISRDMRLLDIFSHAGKALLNNKKGVDEAMLTYYKGSVKQIITKLIFNYPERKGILTEALECHKKKQYSASILILLSQADGIVQGNLFKIAKDKVNLKKVLSENQSSEYLVEVLSKVRGIDSVISNKSNYKSDLNRHEIMHGLTNDFGTELNSLKALSLISFISDLLNTQTSVIQK